MLHMNNIKHVRNALLPRTLTCLDNKLSQWHLKTDLAANFANILRQFVWMEPSQHYHAQNEFSVNIFPNTRTSRPSISMFLTSKSCRMALQWNEWGCFLFVQRLWNSNMWPVSPPSAWGLLFIVIYLRLWEHSRQIMWKVADWLIEDFVVIINLKKKFRCCMNTLFFWQMHKLVNVFYVHFTMS